MVSVTEKEMKRQTREQNQSYSKKLVNGQISDWNLLQSEKKKKNSNIFNPFNVS